MLDIKTRGFEVAMINYEKNVFVNIIKSMNYQNPNLYKVNLLSKSTAAQSWWKCAAATVALAAAVAGTTSCVTIAACALAMVLLYAASNGFAAQCLE